MPARIKDLVLDVDRRHPRPAADPTGAGPLIWIAPVPQAVFAPR